jgi:hypothetical protein
MTVPVLDGQVAQLAAFAQQVRATWEDESDEELASIVDGMAAALRRLDLPEWTAFAALAGLLRQGAGP